MTTDITLAQAARTLDMDILELARRVNLGEINAVRNGGGNVLFHLEALTAYKGTVMDTEAVRITEEPPRSEKSKETREGLTQEGLTREEFTLHWIHERRDESKGQRGLHSSWSGYNAAFSEFFGLDPVAETKRMADAGVISMTATKGGVIIFDASEEYKPKGRIRESALVTYDYENKNKWRERWFAFLRQHLEVGKDTRVLFLPGPEALEISGYDALGIRRENLVGVERHPGKARQIREKKLGFAVIVENLFDYLKKAEGKFSAVLLDYDGKITEDKIKALELIVQRQLLEERAVLGINLFGNRESIEQQMLYLEPYFEEDLASLLEAGAIASDSIPKEVSETGRNLNGVRDYGITAIALKMFMGKDAVNVNRVLMQMLPRQERERWTRYIGENPPKSYMDFLRLNEELRTYLETTFKDEKELAKLVLVAGACFSQPYFPKAMERLAYATASGNNRFFSDFYALEQRNSLYECLDKPFLRRFTSGKLAQVNFLKEYRALPKHKQKKVERDIQRTYQEIALAYEVFFVSDAVPQRVDLTSGRSIHERNAVPPIVEMLKDNVPDEIILGVFPQLSRNRLAGYKAALTRGIYGSERK